MGNSILKSFDEFRHLRGILCLIHEPSWCAFCQQFLRSLLNFFQCPAKTVGEGGWSEQFVNTPGQFCASSCLFGVFINRRCGDVLLEPIEPGFETFDAFLDVFEFLRRFALVMHDSHPPDKKYFIMFHECAHPAEGGLEGREPIGRLFRDIEEDLRATRYSLFPR